jgi:photosystem II stability/assembly factor-like uncharacterized protein
MFNYAAATRKEFQKLQKQIDPSQHGTRITHGHWTPVMPTQFSPNEPFNGRINVIATHPNNENVVFAGAAWGGLWKSTNAGAIWTCLSDGLPVNGISGIVIHPTIPNTMYILTGDGDGKHIPSIGVLKSTNGGATWQPTGLQWTENQIRYGYKLAMNPDQPEIMYAATTHGLYRTTDAWATYSLVVTGSMRDVEFKPDDPTTVYASSWRYILRSTNNGVSWTNLSEMDPILPFEDTNMTRVALAVSPHNPNWVYAVHTWDDVPDGNGFLGLFGSTNAGANWSMVSDTPNITGDGTRNQSYYDLALCVDPENVTHVLVGGVKLFHNTNVTVSDDWIEIGTGAIHADVHDILMTENYVYVATDGGMARSDDGGNTWIDISEGLNIAQIYDFDVLGNRVVEGSQDNGTLLWDIGDPEADHILGGDGFECMFHPTNLQIMYACSQEVRMKSTNGGQNWINITPPGDSAIWDASWIMHPSRPDTLYSAWRTLWRTYNAGSSWTDLNPQFINDKTIRALAQGIDNPNIMYASDRFDLKRTSNLHAATPTWVDVSEGLNPSYLLGGITVDPLNANRVWCTFQGYGFNKVYYSSNGGDDWTDFSGSLPSVPVKCILYQPGSNDGIYIGTTIGIFYRNATLSDWIYFSNGLPVTGVEDLQIEGGYLYAATHGRGVWRSSLYTSCPIATSLTPANDPSNPLSTGVQHYSASHSVLSTRQIVGGIGTDVIYQAGNYVRMDPGFEVKSWNAFEAKIDGCPD